MSTDLRHQSRILAEHALPRSQRERLVMLDVDLAPILESLHPSVRQDLLDAVLALLSRDHLNADQRQALLAPLQAHMAAVLDATGARGRLVEIVS